jgi:carbon-monoxide dehydrogenase medium subunit
MYPRLFEYIRASSLGEAIDMLSQFGEEARVVAGGQSLIPLMKLRLAAPKYIIDIIRVPGLDAIVETDTALEFGALTRHAIIENSPLVQERLPIMHDAAAVIADVQVRNRGTIGGALAHADPNGDWEPVCLALKARVTCAGPEGERTIEVKDLFRDAFTTALNSDEVMTQVSIDLPSGRTGGAYLAFKRRAGDFAAASVAVQLTLEQGGVCQQVGIGLGGVGLTAIKAEAAEAALQGKQLTDTILLEAAEKAVEAASPLDDTRGSEEYKRELVRVLLKRAVRLAARRCQGEKVEVIDV